MKVTPELLELTIRFIKITKSNTEKIINNEITDEDFDAMMKCQLTGLTALLDLLELVEI